MDTATWFHDKFTVLIAEIEDERDKVARLAVHDQTPHDAAEALSELSHTVRKIADRLYLTASATMTVADQVRVGAYQDPPAGPTGRHLRVVHFEELAAEVAAGEHRED